MLSRVALAMMLAGTAIQAQSGQASPAPSWWSQFQAQCAAVLSPCEDIANARLKFANGCIAQLTASRISAERLRRIRVYNGGPAASYLSFDYREQTGSICRVGGNGHPDAKLARGPQPQAVRRAGSDTSQGRRSSQRPSPVAWRTRLTDKSRAR